MTRVYTRGTPEERFWTHVQKGDGCWLWTGATGKFGHGNFWTGRYYTSAHRFSWELVHGPVGDRRVMVRHKCDNPPCVRPDHLELGTHAENMRDMTSRGRQYAGERHWARRAPAKLARGEASKKAKLTAGQVATIRARYAAGGIRQRDLADEFGVGQAQVSRILAGRRWS